MRWLVFWTLSWASLVAPACGARTSFGDSIAPDGAAPGVALGRACAGTCTYGSSFDYDACACVLDNVPDSAPMLDAEIEGGDIAGEADASGAR